MFWDLKIECCSSLLGRSWQFHRQRLQHFPQIALSSALYGLPWLRCNEKKFLKKIKNWTNLKHTHTKKQTDIKMWPRLFAKRASPCKNNSVEPDFTVTYMYEHKPKRKQNGSEGTQNTSLSTSRTQVFVVLVLVKCEHAAGSESLWILFYFLEEASTRNKATIHSAHNSMVMLGFWAFSLPLCLNTRAYVVASLVQALEFYLHCTNLTHLNDTKK